MPDEVGRLWCDGRPSRRRGKLCLQAVDMCNSLRRSTFSVRLLLRTFDCVTQEAQSARRRFILRSAFLCLMAVTATWVPDANAGPSLLDGAAEVYRRYLIEDLGRALTG